MLEFLNPWILLGIPLASLPFWLHLVRRRPKVTFPWPSLMLLREQTPTHRRPTLSELLLLILRALIILLLVLALSLPLWRNDPSAPLTTWLIVDDSWRTSGQLEKVMAAGGELGNALATGYRLGLSTTSGRVLIEPTDNPNTWQSNWSKLGACFYSPSWAGILNDAVQRANSSGGKMRIVMVGQPSEGDLPAVGEGFADGVEFWQTVPEPNPYHGALTSIEPAPGPVLEDKLNIIVSGMVPPDATDLTLRINDVIVARQVVHPSEQTFSAGFSLTRPAGAIRLSAQLGDLPNSPQTQRSVFIPPFRKVQVLSWGNYAHAASAALSALPQSPFVVESATSLPADLTGVDLIVNLDADAILSEEASRLLAYIQAGGKLLLSGRQMVPAGLPVGVSPTTYNGAVVPNPEHPLGKRLADIPLPEAVAAPELLPQGLTRTFLMVGNKAAGVTGTVGSGGFVYFSLGDPAGIMDKPGFAALMFEAARFLCDPAPLLSRDVGWTSPAGTVYAQPGFWGTGTDTFAINVDLDNYSATAPGGEKWQKTYGKAPQSLAWDELLDLLRRERPASLRGILLVLAFVLIVGESLLANYLSRRRNQ